MAPMERLPSLPSLPSLASFLLVLLWSRTTLTTGIPAAQQSIDARQSGSGSGSGSGNTTSSWQQYVRAPSSTTVSPVRLLAAYTTGDVTNPDGVVGNGTTTLTRRDSSEVKPSIVLDFGQNYAGILNINFDGAQAFSDTTALAGITLAFSESLEQLTNRSDFTRSDNQPESQKLTNGTDQVAVQTKPYTWTNQLGCQVGNKVCSDGFHGFRYLKVTLQALPEDAPITTAFGSVSISSVSLTYSGYLGTPDTFTGWFECSDEDITQWWYDAVYTNDLCTDIFRANDTDPRDASNPGLDGKEVLHDGAKRDRDPYVGDLPVSSLTLYLSHDNAIAVRNVLADLADHQRADGWIPPASINNYTLALFDYPLWWVVCSSDLVLYTGDTGYLDTYYPVLVKALDVYYPNATNTEGLLQKGLGTTSGYGDYAFLPRTGVITYYNALYVLALTRAAGLADIHGQSDDAARWRDRAAAAGPALVRENWDESVGAFFDGGPCDSSATGATNSTMKCPVHAQDGNSLAILSGATNNSAARELAGNSSSSTTTTDESILAFMASALARPYGNAFYDNSTLSPSDQFDQRVYAFISYFELAARFQVASSISSSVAESAYEELKRLYGWMARHDPFSTFWEGIAPYPGSENLYYEGGFTSLAHGWATGIVPLMQNYVLGVRPTGPGFKTYEVWPVTSGRLRWARGAVPTPWGAVEVKWSVQDSDADADGVNNNNGLGLSLSLSTPAGTTGTVYVPVAEGDSEVTMDGSTIWTRDGGGVLVEGVSYEGGRVVVRVEGGSNIIFRTS